MLLRNPHLCLSINQFFIELMLHNIYGRFAKGQLVSERIFCVFKSPKNLVGFLGELKTLKIHSEINCSL